MQRVIGAIQACNVAKCLHKFSCMYTIMNYMYILICQPLEYSPVVGMLQPCRACRQIRFYMHARVNVCVHVVVLCCLRVCDVCQIAYKAIKLSVAAC